MNDSSVITITISNTTQLCTKTIRFRQISRAIMVFSVNVEFNINALSDSNADAASIRIDETRNQTAIANAMRGASSPALLPLSAVVERVIPTTVINKEEADHQGPRTVRAYLLFISRRARWFQIVNVRMSSGLLNLFIEHLHIIAAMHSDCSFEL